MSTLRASRALVVALAIVLLTGCRDTKPPAAPAGLAPAAVAAPSLVAPSPHLRWERGAGAWFGLKAKWEARPDDVPRSAALAMWLYDHHEYRAALPLLRWLSGRVEGDGEAARGLLGMTWIRLGRLDRAAEAFDGLTRDYPTSWAGPYHRALTHLRRQEFDAARRGFAEAVARKGDSPFGRHGLGVSLYKLGRDADAAAELRRAVELMPTHPSARFDLMNALRRLGDREADDTEHRAYWARRRDGANLKPIVHTVAMKAGAAAGMRFVDVAPQLGLDDPGRGRASALVDVDGDGHLDVFAGNLEERSHFWRADGRGGFADVTDAAGLGTFDSGYGHAFADYDGDGDLDVYVTRGGFQNGRPGRDANLLFANEGGAPPRFADVTAAAGVGDAGVGFASVWADFDGDGPVDLYVVNNYTANRLYRNRGDGGFDDITEAAGVGDRRGGVSAAVADYDGDGDLDIYVANNGQANILYRNEGGSPPTFTDVTGKARVGLSGGFASVAGDFNNDGRMDLYVTNMNDWFGGADFRPGDPCYLLINQGDGTFAEVASDAGVAYVGGPMGLAAGDLDYDGWLDLYLGNGGPEPRRWEPDLLYRNLGASGPSGAGGVRFVDVTQAAGVWNDRMGHGVSLGDYDRDGDLDMYLPNGAHVPSDVTPNKLWRNEGHGRHWVAFSLVGKPPNTAAIGAQVTLTAGPMIQLRQVSGGGGFGAQDSLEVEFGLGATTRVDRVKIRWPTGAVQVLSAPAIDRFHTVKQAP